jgi:iron complex outermembrane receptor protein
MRTLAVRCFVFLAGFAAVASPCLAQTGPPSLAQISIEDLMNIEITSASRKEQRAGDVAAAVFVITQEDIRNSGLTTLPDLLRLAPGVDVAQVNANKWAVSIRGFNGVFANKLLVLINGRSLYNRLFSGVLWDTTDVVLDNIERIEVIRGPGAAMWGANAVNGVINIVTKTASVSVGGLVRVAAGQAGEQVTARYGAALGSADYRLYAQWTRRDQSVLASGASANDGAHSLTTGFRADWTARPGAFMAEGSFTAGQARALWPNLDPSTAAREPLAHVVSSAHGGHVLGLWTHARPGGSSLTVRTYLDAASRSEPLGDYRRLTFDIDSQFHARLGRRHDLVIGAGYRSLAERLSGRNGISLTPPSDTSALLSAFIQDEIAFFGNRLAVTLGSQVQHDSISGGGVQPSARAVWKGFPRQRLWASTSRALRTPSLQDRGIRVEVPPTTFVSGLPLAITAVGNPLAQPEHVVDVEAGYRLEIGSSAAIDVTAFAARYNHLVTAEPGLPVIRFVPTPQISVTSQFGNLPSATTRGVEVSAQWAPTRVWRLDASLTLFDFTPRVSPASLDASAATDDGDAPRSQWQIRSTLSPGRRSTIHVALFHVGRLAQLQVAPFTRLDATAEWRFSSRVSAVVTGQSLLHAAHSEFATSTLEPFATRVPRTVGVQVRWLFR